jgi:hypothetical protein
VPAAVPRAVIDTLKNTGTVPILFGHIVGTDIAFMRPTLYALYRDSIVVNHETHGDAPRVVDWPLIMAEIEPELLVHAGA